MLSFSNVLHYLSTCQDKGKAFEYCCKWFLENDPGYSKLLKNVWLWSDWPDRWGRDKGIDLVAEDYAGKIWAIQAKAYEEKYSVTKADIDTFLSESSREKINFRLLIATTNLIGDNAKEVIDGQEKFVGTCLLDSLEGSSVDWSIFLDGSNSNSKKDKKIFKPYSHQERAIKDIEVGFSKSFYGQLHMACGTGKTLVGLWLAERLKCNVTLVLVPSISLVAQLYREWSEHSSKDFDFYPIFVCSDETVGKKGGELSDRFIFSPAQLGLPVTTNPQDILGALHGSLGPKVIFSTYHSSPVIAQACKIDSSINFDLVIADEAHRCAGPAKSDFATIVYKDKIRAKRKLFMTATPKIFTDHVKKSTKELDYEVVSMDDHDKFGPVFHRLSFSDAIKDNLLVDYQVIISVMDNKQYKEYIEKGRLVAIDDFDTDARTLASQLIVAKAIRANNLTRVISFHNRKKNAKEFVDTLPKAISLLNENEKPEIAFRSMVHGEMSQEKRSDILRPFKKQTQGDVALLANVRCLSEGVDIPELDGIAFIDPKGSVIDIVQAIGRVIRKPKNKMRCKDSLDKVCNKPEKTVGTIIIPVFIDGVEDEEITLEKSCFRDVWRVIRALRAHDDVLAEELDNIRLELGKRTYRSPSKLAKIYFDVPVGIGAEFTETLKLRITENCSSILWLPFDEARIFVRKLRLKNFNQWCKWAKSTMRYKNIPSAPNKVYAGKGWIDLGDFLGTNFIATQNREYCSFDDAKIFVKSLGIKTEHEWREWKKNNSLPANIPAKPERVYRSDGWAGFGDFFGTGLVANKNRVFLSFDEAKLYVNKIGLKNKDDWAKWAKSEMRPKNIPASPSNVYKSEGWLGWGDFLGTNIIANKNRKYRTFEEARIFARSLYLKSKEDWFRYIKTDKLPSDVPIGPRNIYIDDGWVGWGDFLGTGNVRKKKFKNFVDARAFARTLNFKSRREWNSWAKNGNKPNDIPYKPDRTYKNAGWLGWGDWFGTSN